MKSILLLPVFLALGACSGQPTPSEPATAPAPAPEPEPAPVPTSEPSPAPVPPELWSQDCTTWAGMAVPWPEKEGAIEVPINGSDRDRGPCKPGSPPTGKDSLAVLVYHSNVQASDKLFDLYAKRAENAGWTRISKPEALPELTHPDYPGWVLTVDGHLDEEGGGFMDIQLIMKPVQG